MTYSSIPTPETSTLVLLLDNFEHSCNAFICLDGPFHFPTEINVGHVPATLSITLPSSACGRFDLRLHFSRMHCQNACIAILPTPSLQFGRHMSKHLIKCGLACAVGPETIFIMPKNGSRSRVRGDKRNFGRRRFRVEIDKFLGTNDRPDSVGVQVDCKVGERAAYKLSALNSAR